MYEFRYGKFLKIFAFIFCPALFALFVWALLQFDHQNPAIYFAVILPVSLGMIGLSVYGIIDIVKGKFIIADDRVTLHSPFGQRFLLLGEIRGFRRDENYIRITPLKESQKEIKVSTYIKDADLIIQWLAALYVDLDAVAGDEEERQVLESDEFGMTEESRRQRLVQARKVATFVNGGAWVLVAWLFFFPEYNYSYAITIGGLYPLIAILVTMHYRGLMSPDEYEHSKMPSTGIAFILPGIMLALRALMDFTMLMHPIFLWVTMAIVSITLSCLYMIPSFKLATKRARFYGTGLTLIFLNLFYSYGVLVTANCLLDRSQPSDYETKVVGKHVSNGKTTTYYVHLNPWGTISEVQEIKVTQQDYEMIQEGDPLIVTEHAGYLKMPWIEIEP